MVRNAEIDRLLKHPNTIARRALRAGHDAYGKHVLGRLSTQSLIQYFRLRSKIRSDVSDANPLRIRWVDPDEIQYYHEGVEKRFGVVLDGDWDRQRSEFSDHVTFRSIKRRFVDDFSWEQTPLFELYTEEVNRGERRYGRSFSSKTELYEYCSAIDRLYQSITREGYKQQASLGAEAGDPVGSVPHPALHEISVHVYRDGSLAKTRSGTHRLSIAKVANVKYVPVLVRARHAEWQAVRDAVRSTDSLSQLPHDVRANLDHPDLDDIRAFGSTSQSS